MYLKNLLLLFFIAVTFVTKVAADTATVPPPPASATTVTTTALPVAPAPVTPQAPINNAVVSVWANEAIVTVYTFDAGNYVDNLKQVAKFFTRDGWSAFLTALDSSKIADTVKQNNYKVTAVALSPPRITAQGITDNQYSWTVTMPTLVSYQNNESQHKQYLDITLTMVYSGTASGVRGLAVTQFNAQELSKPTTCQCAS